MATNTFPGFPVDLFDFLRDLSKNNDRDWFKANKERYLNSVVGPVCNFISIMGERLNKISTSFIADPRPHGGSMFRIYRDTRFSKDKRPYKENVGCQFSHILGKDAHAPGFYVHLQPDHVFLGAGAWKPPNPTLDQIRKRIVDHPNEWSKVIKNRKIIKRFTHVEGEQLKRPPRGYEADHIFIEDLKKKTFFLGYTVDPDLALTSKFIDEVDQTFKDAKPLMAFLTSAMGISF